MAFQTSQRPWNPELCFSDIIARALIGHQMAALIGFWPKLRRAESLAQCCSGY